MVFCRKYKNRPTASQEDDSSGPLWILCWNRLKIEFSPTGEYAKQWNGRAKVEQQLDGKQEKMIRAVFYTGKKNSFSISGLSTSYDFLSFILIGSNKEHLALVYFIWKPLAFLRNAFEAFEQELCQEQHSRIHDYQSKWINMNKSYSNY